MSILPSCSGCLSEAEVKRLNTEGANFVSAVTCEKADCSALEMI